MVRRFEQRRVVREPFQQGHAPVFAEPDGYTFVPDAAPVNFQTFWSWNATFDSRGYSWANFFEIGPGVRFRFDAMPRSMFFTVQALRGTYLVHDAAHRPQYNDFRAGVWYAFTR